MNDRGNLVILEGFIVGLIMLGAVAFVMSSADPVGVAPTAPGDLRVLLDDATRVLSGLPESDERYSGRYLNKAVAAAAGGDTSLLDSKLRNLLPAGASYNVHLDNGYRTRPLHESATPSGERVSSSSALVPRWSLAYALTDFEVHSNGVGTPMKLTVVPVHQGGALDGSSHVWNGGFELDGDGDSVPDRWTPSVGVTDSVQVDVARVVWDLDGPAGTLAAATEFVAADAGTRFLVTATLKGEPACVQFHFYDEDKVGVPVGGSETECSAATLASELDYVTVTDVYEVPAEDAIAFVRVELASAAGGLTRFDSVAVEPAGKVEAGGAALDLLESPVPGVYTRTLAVGEYAALPIDTDLDLSVAIRHRGAPLPGTITYRTSDNALLPAVWANAQTGLDASTFTAASPTVPVGDSVVLTYDFTAYEAALSAAGVGLTSPKVKIAVYEPLARTDERLQLARVETMSGGLAGTYAFEHDGAGLYGPTLLVAYVESGLSKAGFDLVPMQKARKALVLESTLSDGTLAVPPVYRVAVEAWFEGWG